MMEKETEDFSPENDLEDESREELADQFISKYELKKKTEYETENGYHYRTDRLGRIVEVTGTLKLEPETKANPTAQRMAGGEDRHTGIKNVEGKLEYDPDDRDDGGHLIARMFGGSPEMDNLVAMNYHLNRGKYLSMERKWKNDLSETDENGDPINEVNVKIKVKYEEDSKRPVSFEIQSETRNLKTGETSYVPYRFKNKGD